MSGESVRGALCWAHGGGRACGRPGPIPRWRAAFGSPSRREDVFGPLQEFIGFLNFNNVFLLDKQYTFVLLKSQ